MTDPHVDALATELHCAISGVLARVGVALADEFAAHPPDALGVTARRWATTILGPDEWEARHQMRIVIDALWPTRCEPAIDWTSPLGRAILRTVGHPTRTEVTYSAAGEMLGGVSKQRVGQLVIDRRLTVGESGGVTAESIRTLARERGAK